MSGVTLNLGFVKIELLEFIKFLHSISSVKLDDKSKGAIIKAIDEIRSGYQILVDTFYPFYSITNDKKFEEELSKKYEIFGKTYKMTYEIRLSACHEVYNMIHELRKEEKEKFFKNKFPWVKKELNKLEKLADEWFLNDGNVSDEMNKFHKDLDKRLVSIRKKRRRLDAWNELQILLEEAKPKLDEIVPQLVQLSALKYKFR